MGNVNSDGAVNKETGKVGAAAVIWNVMELFNGALTKQMEHCSVLGAEAEGMRQGVMWAAQQQMNQVCFKTDFQAFFHIVQKERTTMEVAGCILRY